MSFHSDLDRHAQTAIDVARECNGRELEYFSVPTLSRACGLLGLPTSSPRKSLLVDRLLRYFQCAILSPARVVPFEDIGLRETAYQKDETLVIACCTAGTMCGVGLVFGCTPVDCVASACLGASCGECMNRSHRFVGRLADRVAEIEEEEEAMLSGKQKR
jgi:hypothetical protein